MVANAFAAEADTWFTQLKIAIREKLESPLPWHPATRDICQRVSDIGEQSFNGVLLNWYRGGQDMGWHADDEPELGINPIVASVSLGATRRAEPRKLLLNHSSLLVMAGEMQHHWQHALLKMAACSTPRINLTFRWLVE